MNGSAALYSMIMGRFSKQARKNGRTDAAAGNHGGFERPNPDTPVSGVDYVVLDTELTGLKPRRDSIVSIGALRMTGGRIHVGDSFYRIIEPRTRLTGESVLIHGITPSEASECPDIERLLPEFLDFCIGRVLVGHFISIDLEFINREMIRLFGHPMKSSALDTARIYRWLRHRDIDTCAYAGEVPDDMALSALAKKFGIEMASAHNALSDAFVTAQLFQRFLNLLPGFGIATIGDLLKIGGCENR